MWCLLWEIPLFSPSNVFFFFLLSSLSVWLDSVICGKIEKIASITATFIIRNSDTQLDSHGQSARARRQHVPHKTASATVRKGCGLVLFFFFFPPTALFSARHKIRSPCTGTQGLSQCDWGIARGPSWQAENIAWLFLLLQPMNNTYAVLSLPCGHCWQVRLVWSLKKDVEDLKTVSVDAFVSTLKTHLL